MKQITVLTGQNEVLKLEYLKNLTKNFDKDEIYNFYLDETDCGNLFGETESYSLFTKRRLFIFKNFDLCKESIKKELKNKIMEFVSREIDDTFFIILSEENFLSESEKIEVIDFKKLYRNDILNYIISRLNDQKIQYEDSLPDYIVELSCENLEAAIKMLEIIFNYYEEGKKLTIEDMDTLFTREKGYGIFDFIDGVFTKDRKKAYISLQDLKDSKESIIQINYLLNRTAKLMWSYLSEKDKSALSSKLKIKPFELKKLSFYSSKIDLKYLSHLFSMIKKIEIASKTMSTDFAFLELEKFILTI